jgi:plasmid maintenance system antidote protein VapI
MKTNDLMTNPAYNPDRLLDAMLKTMALKNDAALSRRLGVQPPVISKIRHRRNPITASLLILLHEHSDMPIRELKSLMVAPTVPTSEQA